MKKSEIKRRKRVVPALRDQKTANPGTGESPASQSQHNANEFKDDSIDLSAFTNDSPVEVISGRGAPVPVDFTNYQAPSHGDTPLASASRKRSVSEADNKPVAQKIRRLVPKSDVVARQQHENIDPNLSIESVGSIKLRLLADMQELRQILAQKEDQFAELLARERASQSSHSHQQSHTDRSSQPESCQAEAAAAGADDRRETGIIEPETTEPR